MKHVKLLVLIGLLLIAASTVEAQAGASTPLSTGYDLSWNVVAAGGDTSTGSGYTLMGTIGQSDAGALMTGAGYSLAGGFWANGSSQYQVFLPIVIK